MYKVAYHLAAGVSVNVDGITEEDVDKLQNALEFPDKVIIVGGRTGTKRQFIPVRSILVVNVEEEKGE